MLRFIFVIAAMFLSTQGWAFGEVVLVSSVKGLVTLEAAGIKKSSLQPFIRLKAGDRLNIPADGQVSLIYFKFGRQEIWPGNAVLMVGDSESKKIEGNVEAQLKLLPKEVTRQMNQTIPSPDGKVSLASTRSIADVDEVYKKLRSTAAATDIEPELYLLAGLFERKNYTRLESEMERIAAAFPDDDALKLLRKLYSKAIADAKLAGKKENP